MDSHVAPEQPVEFLERVDGLLVPVGEEDGANHGSPHTERSDIRQENGP
jgi:hypothetical protein